MNMFSQKTTLANHSANTVFSIQYLRAIAVLMVVFHHAREQFPGFQVVFPTTAGAAGVDLFFVISGFVMVFISSAKPRSAANFFLMRVIRIVPIYWFYTTVAALLLLLAHFMFKRNEFTISHYILSLLFIPHQAPANPSSWSPMVKLGWTLNFEMFFYLIYAFSIKIYSKNPVLPAAMALLLLVLLGLFLKFDSVVMNFYTSSIILEFAFGMIIGYLYVRGRILKLNMKAGVLLIAGGFAAIFYGNLFFADVNRVLIYGVPAMAIVYGCVSFESQGYVPLLRLPLFIGDASYSIYLVHLLPIVILRRLLPYLGIPTEGVTITLLFVLASLFGGVAIGFISNRWIERPSSKALQDVWRRKVKAGAAFSNANSTRSAQTME